ncbi:pyruvate decarboxylase-like protein [Penicillium maclennaniae]|uniref:pyruvate decarboxylase-like protein n=1 Tax=Penicillium maclennaniae TaxID=1343394 RepID=UPI002541E034|nr:pyruvate decarboxylase-like protein [Penicillium maclennaniae]KAJ5661742.1 pyruvate decarboxylase-like protein [Penicillium maclennaniae]
MQSRINISLSQYLFSRLKEIGIRSVHGVPGSDCPHILAGEELMSDTHLGDYNLASLDYVAKAGLRWIGNCNELNAGYAADGYARIHGISALMTVAGVGELSALNAIAGAFAEYVPIVHILGQPSLASQRQKMLLHHSLGDGNFADLARMSERVTATSVQINCGKQAPRLIDDAIAHCWKSSRPVSIILPTDMVHVPVLAENLARPLDLSAPLNDKALEAHAADAIFEALRKAKSPLLLVGGYNVRFTKRREVRLLAEKLGLPIYLSASGRGIIDEQDFNFNGLYFGDCSDSEVMQKIRSSDLIISIGNIHSDLNVASCSWSFDLSKMVELRDEMIHVQGKAYPGLNSTSLLQAIIRCSVDPVPKKRRLSPALPLSNLALEMANERMPFISKAAMSQEPARGDRLRKGVRMSHTMSYKEGTNTMRHDWLWPMLSDWLRPGDTIIAETGVNFISQYVWASIGYSLGACQGAAAAVQDSSQPDRRTILFIGDGSFQFTCQELSTIIRYKLAPIIFVICNKGYTVERLIHGWNEPYNDIQEWQYRKLLEAFGADRGSYQTHQIWTRAELTALLQDPSFSESQTLRFVELHMDRDDAPSNLTTLTQQLVARDSQTRS